MDQLAPMRDVEEDNADPFAAEAPAEDTSPFGDPPVEQNDILGQGAAAAPAAENSPMDMFDAPQEEAPAAAEDAGDFFAGAIDADAKDSPLDAPVIDENGPYRKWEAKYKARLEEQVIEARKKKEKILEGAEEELKAFYKEKEDTVAKSHKTNLDDEKQKRADIEKLFKTGDNKWEKVCKMLSLAPNSNRKVDRFRRLLTKLKIEGTYCDSALKA